MRESVAEVIINISHEKLDRPFEYRIPDSLRDSLRPGMRVIFPFGKSDKETEGYVIRMKETSDYPYEKLKCLVGIAPKHVTMEDTAIRLAIWMKEQYGSTLITALKTVLPVKKTVKENTVKTVVNVLSEAEWEPIRGRYERKHQEARLRLAAELLLHEQLPYELVTGKLGVSAQILKAMETAGEIRIEESRAYRNPTFRTTGKGLPTPSPEQQKIIDGIGKDVDEKHPGNYLLRGITGSGKTLVYIYLIRHILSLGKQAIVLIPEISLTYQTVMRFTEAFGDRVTFVNSKLSMGERFDQFERAKRGEVDVVIGPRSALFVPFHNLGMIIIDEEHENSYKSENMPKYHAREVAMELASYHGAGVVLGSATPSVEATYMARNGLLKEYRLEKRLTGGTLPTVYIEDMRSELKKRNLSVFSERLQNMIDDRLDRGEQVMLFLNRRGYQGFISCASCGEIVKCPHCDVSLSEHRNGTMVCHYCGYTIPRIHLCPKCGSKYLNGFKLGTEKLEEAVWRTFPRAKTLRMDFDTTREKNQYEEILSSFANREADILIGTQMIVKGHDFPNVTLVGMIAADISLGAHDFHAGERTFQLLTQAAGRAGRGTKPGEVVIQTYQPENPYIQYAAAQDYDSFYEEEIAFRTVMDYPPYGHMLCVQVFGENSLRAKELIGTLSEWIHSEADSDSQVRVVGPSINGVEKIKDEYRYVTYVKCRNRDRLVAIKNLLERRIAELPIGKCYVQFDFDPISM